MMPSANEQKEDIRLRIADLETKLAKSEEKRRELEEACDILLRVFREEEKMHYNALNNKYEKFLQDYSVRKKRNCIILTSLCRIEDRSRALFSKTERLKLLRDHYVSYLKINEFKDLWKNFPIDSVKATEDVATKAVRWKTPLSLSCRSENESREARGDFVSGQGQHNLLPYESISGSPDTEQYHEEKSNEFQNQESRTKSLDRSPDADFHVRQKDAISVETKSEVLARGRTRITVSKNDDVVEDEHPIEMTATSEMEVRYPHDPMEKLRNTGECPASNWHEPKHLILSENSDFTTRKIDPVIIQNGSFNKLTAINHNVVISGPKIRSSEEQDDQITELDIVQTDLQEEVITNETSPEPDKALPLGLDGVDYQNETYPESYYEQPVHHHNHTSIASDVILEEDETEQDLDDDEEKNLSADDSHEELELHAADEMKESEQVNGRTSVIELSLNCAAKKASELTDKGYLKRGDVDEVSENVKSQQSDSEKSFEAKQPEFYLGEPKSSPSEKDANEKSEKNRSAVKSNLIHMLESDSESFQIENGDGLSRNEDSDFDFSFGKN